MINSQHRIRPSIRRKMRIKKMFVFLIFTACLMCSYYGYKYWKYYKEPAPTAIAISDIVKENAKVEIPIAETNSSISVETEKTQEPLPKELNLKMPFYTQAPFFNWDYPWQEACEEASVLLVANVYLNKNWTREEFNNEILKMVEWEKGYFGDYKHTSVSQTAEMAEKLFKLKAVIHENPTYFDIKQILAKGHLIIMTFDGKVLGNPNYKNGGPIYHAMVIKGYKEGDKIITHDVGTRRGEDYVYKWKVIENALHDYAEPMKAGEKRVIEVVGS